MTFIEVTPWPTILMIIAAVIVGYGIGILDSRITKRLRIGKQKEIESGDKNIGAKTDQVGSDPVLVQGVKDLPGEHVVLKISTDQSLNWHFELDGIRLDKPENINPVQRKKIINVLVQMRPWLENNSLPVAKTSPSDQPSQTQVSLPRTEDRAGFLSEPTTASQNAMAQHQPEIHLITPPKVDAMRGIRSILSNDDKHALERKTQSIVEMIDEVLQTKLMGTTLADKNIRLEDGKQGEVIVCVGPQRYSSLGAVPDPEIRNMIKSAIAEWEKK